MPDSPIRTKAFAAVDTSGSALFTSAGQIHGLVVSASEAATVTLYDHASAASGTILWQGVFAAAGTQTFTFPAEGVQFLNGLFIDPSAGTTTGSVWVVA